MKLNEVPAPEKASFASGARSWDDLQHGRAFVFAATTVRVDFNVGGDVACGLG